MGEKSFSFSFLFFLNFLRYMGRWGRKIVFFLFIFYDGSFSFYLLRENDRFLSFLFFILNKVFSQRFSFRKDKVENFEWSP